MKESQSPVRVVLHGLITKDEDGSLMGRCLELDITVMGIGPGRTYEKTAQTLLDLARAHLDFESSGQCADEENKHRAKQNLPPLPKEVLQRSTIIFHPAEEKAWRPLTFEECLVEREISDFYFDSLRRIHYAYQEIHPLGVD